MLQFYALGIRPMPGAESFAGADAAELNQRLGLALLAPLPGPRPLSPFTSQLPSGTEVQARGC